MTPLNKETAFWEITNLSPPPPPHISSSTESSFANKKICINPSPSSQVNSTNSLPFTRFILPSESTQHASPKKRSYTKWDFGLEQKLVATVQDALRKSKTISEGCAQFIKEHEDLELTNRATESKYFRCVEQEKKSLNNHISLPSSTTQEPFSLPILPSDSTTTADRIKYRKWTPVLEQELVTTVKDALHRGDPIQTGCRTFMNEHEEVEFTFRAVESRYNHITKKKKKINNEASKSTLQKSEKIHNQWDDTLDSELLTTIDNALSEDKTVIQGCEEFIKNHPTFTVGALKKRRIVLLREQKEKKPTNAISPPPSPLYFDPDNASPLIPLMSKTSAFTPINKK